MSDEHIRNQAMNLDIRKTCGFIIVMTALLTVTAPSLAQTAATGSGQACPVKPIRMVVPFTPGGSTPEQFAAYIKTEIERCAKVIKASGVHIE